ncbi:MAG: leucine-rich repeat domain-containing protein [Candidatus Hodarchaeales archaeon]
MSGSFGLLWNLEYLDLTYNQLSTLPEALGQLTNLKHLDLRSNKKLGQKAKVWIGADPDNLLSELKGTR